MVRPVTSMTWHDTHPIPSTRSTEPTTETKTQKKKMRYHSIRKDACYVPGSAECRGRRNSKERLLCQRIMCMRVVTPEELDNIYLLLLIVAHYNS